MNREFNRDRKSGVSLNSSVTGVRIRERTRVCDEIYDNEKLTICDEQRIHAGRKSGVRV